MDNAAAKCSNEHMSTALEKKSNQTSNGNKHKQDLMPTADLQYPVPNTKQPDLCKPASDRQGAQ